MQNREQPEDRETPFFEETENALLRTLHALLTERLENQGLRDRLRMENERLRLQLSDMQTQGRTHIQEEIDHALEPRLDRPRLQTFLQYAHGEWWYGPWSVESLSERLARTLLRRFSIRERPLPME